MGLLSKAAAHSEEKSSDAFSGLRRSSSGWDVARANTRDISRAKAQDPAPAGVVSDTHTSFSYSSTRSSTRAKSGIVSFLTSKTRKAESSRYTTRTKARERSKAGAAKHVRSLGETVTSVVISEDKHFFAASATNKKAVVMQVSDGKVVAEFTAESGINASAIGGLGYEARLIVGTFSGWIRVYHISTNLEEHSLKFGEGDAIFCMALAANSTRLAVGGKSSHVLVYALSFSAQAVGMNVLYRFATNGTSTLTLALDAAAETLVAGGESKVVQVRGVPPSFPHALTSTSSSLPHLLLLPASPVFLTPFLTFSLVLDQMWVIPTNASSSTPGTAASIVAAVETPCGAARKTPAIKLGDARQQSRGRAEGDAEDPSLLPRVQFRTASMVHSLALNGAGTTLAVGTSEHTEIYRVILQRDQKYPDAPPTYFCEPLLVLECPALQGGVAFSQNEQIAIGGNQLVSVFDLETGGMLVKMEREDRVRCVALSTDGECLVIGGFDKMVRMQMIERGTELYHFSYDKKSTVKTVCLSADALQLAMGCESAGKGSVIVFNASRCAPLGHLLHLTSTFPPCTSSPHTSPAHPFTPLPPPHPPTPFPAR